MDLEFGDESLKRLYSNAGFGMGLPLPVVKSFRRKVYFISEATDERDLRAWKALHVEKLKGDREHQCSIRLNEKYRLVFEIFGDGQESGCGSLALKTITENSE